MFRAISQSRVVGSSLFCIILFLQITITRQAHIFNYIVNGWHVTLFSTLRIVTGGGNASPLENPTRTYPLFLKILGGLEVDNSSTTMQFQVI